MSNLKIGDLCLIVGESPDNGNIGKSCTLQMFVQAGDSYQMRGIPRQINASGVAVWICVGESLVDGYGRPGYCQKAPENLMKIRGDFQPEQQKSQEVPA